MKKCCVLTWDKNQAAFGGGFRWLKQPEINTLEYLWINGLGTVYIIVWASVGPEYVFRFLSNVFLYALILCIFYYVNVTHFDKECCAYLCILKSIAYIYSTCSCVLCCILLTLPF